MKITGHLAQNTGPRYSFLFVPLTQPKLGKRVTIGEDFFPERIRDELEYCLPRNNKRQGGASGGDSFPVVGIGASAGGLEALLEFFKELPPTGMAFVVITHLEPNHESQLVEIIGSASSLPVAVAQNGVRLKPDHIYVLPPNGELTLREGVLQLTARNDSAKPHYPIDLFFESLANDEGSGAIGIILSGGGSDGAQGVRAIKSKCGTTFAQDQQSAKHPSMPYSAIATGAIDSILTPSRMAGELVKLKIQPFLGETQTAETGPEPTLAEWSPEETGEFSGILNLLRVARSVDFSQYKPTTIGRRIRRRMLIHHFESVDEYVAHLESHPDAVQDLYRDILINVTSFFREPATFEGLRGKLLEMLARRRPPEPFRIWVPGCSTGEEVYSFAIALTELIESTGKQIPLQVFGTDISDDAVDRARRGIFPESIQHDVTPERLRRFFVRADAGYRTGDQIRQSCVFAHHDLTADPPFSQMDLVSCRNVLIYMGGAAQQRILPMLHYALKNGGILVLGSAETIGTRTDLFSTVDGKQKIYLRKPVHSWLGPEFFSVESLTRALPAMPRNLSSTISSFADIEARAARLLREIYAPAGVLINEDMQILHFHGQTRFYLEPPQGEASLNLLRLARESLVYPLRNLVDRVIEKREAVDEPGVRVEYEGEVRVITLRVIPVGEGANVFLVVFEEPRTAADQPATGVDEAPGQSAEAISLQLAQQRELTQIREYLRKVVEQYEAATEELRAANEEARSANEELQSTNEELRTAKEELQSSNEELTTVNDELKHRNDELRLATNDLGNVLGAVMIPIFMVGMDLRLRRFTPPAERLLNLKASDIGQPISDIHSGLHLPKLNEMILEVIRTLEVRQQRAQDFRGRWYEVFVRPYRTGDDRIEGAVVALIDVDESTRALQEAELARNFAEGIVETVQHPLLVLDAEMKIMRATAAFYRLFQVSPEETEGKRVEELSGGEWDLPELRRLLDSTLSRDIPFQDVNLELDFRNIGRRSLRLNARRITTGAIGLPHRVLLAIEDVTERREAAEIQYRRLFETAKDAILILDAESGRVTDVNPFFTQLTRYSRGEVVGKPFWELDAFLHTDVGHRLVPEAKQNEWSRFDSVPMRARDGRELTLELIANQYRVRDAASIQVNIRDVTSRRRMEERLRRSNLDLQQFAYAASHDLQEPLRTLSTFSQLLTRRLEGKVDAQTSQHLSFISAAADRMSQMVLDLLGYSQIGRVDGKIVPMPAEAVLSSAILNLQMAIQDTNACITFDPLPTVMIEEMQFLQLLQNLIGNALKYRSSEPPRIHIALATPVRNGCSP